MTTTRDDDADWLRSIAEHPDTTDADHAAAKEDPARPPTHLPASGNGIASK